MMLSLFDTLPPEQSQNDKPLRVPLLAFTIFGTPQQRGSKSPVPRGKRGGGFQYRKNGKLIIDVKDSNKKSKPYMDAVSMTAALAFKKAGYSDLITDPIELGVKFYFKRPKCHFGTGKNAKKLKPSAPAIHAQSPDLAKLIRCLEDALTGVVWRDDCLVFRYTDDTQRYWTTEQERAEVAIYVHRQG